MSTSKTRLEKFLLLVFAVVLVAGVQSAFKTAMMAMADGDIEEIEAVVDEENSSKEEGLPEEQASTEDKATKEESGTKDSQTKEKEAPKEEHKSPIQNIIPDIKINNSVCKIGDTEYETVAAAVESVPTSGASNTISMLTDSAEDQQVEIQSGQNVVIDLAGKTISYGGGSELTSGVLMVHNGGQLSIKDTQNNGAVKSGTNAYAAVALTKDGDASTLPATFTLDNGTLEGDRYAITGHGSRNNTNITINNGTIKGTSSITSLGIYHPQSGTLTVNGGTIKGLDSAIEMRAGTLNIGAGTFTSTASTYSCTPNDSGSTTVGAAIAVAQHNTKQAINVNITGGTFYGVKAFNEADPQQNHPTNITASITSGKFKGEVSSVDVTKFLSGGLYSTSPITNYLADEKKVRYNPDVSTKTEYPYIVTTNSVCKIGDTEFKTLVAAVATIPTTGALNTIAMLDDTAEIEQVELVSGQNVALDLCGYTITYDGANELTSGVLMVHNGATLSVSDSENNGAIKSGDKAFAAVALTKDGDSASLPATFTLDNGILEGKLYAITGHGSRNNTITTINGGTIKGTSADTSLGIYHPQDGTLTINGGTISGLDSAIEMRSGTLNIYDGSFTATAANYSCTPNDSGSTTVGAAIAVAQHNTKQDIEINIAGGNFEGVRTINEEDPQQNSPTNITMSISGSKFKGQIYSKDVTKFLSGGLYSASPDINYVVDNMIISDNLDESTKTVYPYVIVNDKVCKIGDVEYNSLASAIATVPTTGAQTQITMIANSSEADQVDIVLGQNVAIDLAGRIITYGGSSEITSGVLMVHNGASLTIDDSLTGGAIKSGDKATAAVALTKAGDSADQTASLVVNNGTLEGSLYAITGHGSRNNTSIVVNNGTITGTGSLTSLGIYHPQDGTLTVNGGTISGLDSAIEMRSGTLNINAGKYFASATEYKCVANISGSTTVGAAIAIAQHTTKQDINVNIKGGQFQALRALNEADPQLNNPTNINIEVEAGFFKGDIYSKDVTGFLSGGLYSVSPDTNYIVEGKAVADNLDHSTKAEYPYMVSEFVCKIGDVGYASIQSALQAAQFGNKILLVKDVELDANDSTKVSLDINKTGVTLDGAGHKISPKADSYWDEYKAGGASQDYGSYNLVIVSADFVAVQNLTVDVEDYRGMSCLTTKGGQEIQYSSVLMCGDGSGHYAGKSGSGLIVFTDCTFQTKGYGINFSNDDSQAIVIIDSCVLNGWNSFGKLNSVTVRDTKFKNTYDNKNKNMAGFRPYCPTTLKNCTFAKEFAMGDQGSDYIYVGVGTGEATNVSFYGCSVEGGYDLQKIINYKEAFNSDEAALNSAFIFEGVTDSSQNYVAAKVQTKSAQLPAKASGSEYVKVIEASGETPQSGNGDIYYLGKDAQGQNHYITAGSFTLDPGAHINTAKHTIVDSGDNDCPYLVKEKDQSDPVKPIIVQEETKVEVSEEIPVSQQTAAKIALSSSSVDGVKEALKGDLVTHEKILAKAKDVEGSSVTDTAISNASLIKYDIAATIKAVACDSQKEGKIKFEVKPIAKVTTHLNGVITGTAENVAVENEWLNGDDIEIVLGCTDVEPKQVVHTRDNGENELFKEGTVASYDNRTFKFDSESQNITVMIRDFSTITISGTNDITELTITGSTTNAKLYDGSTTAVVNVGEVKGIKAGDDVTVKATGAFVDANAGTSKAVNVVYTLEGKDINKYSLPANQTLNDGVINKRSVTLTSDSATKAYDGTPLTAQNVEESGEGFIDGEGATYTVTGSQTIIGKSENTFTYELNDITSENNYNITKVNGTLEVTENAPGTRVVSSGTTKTGDSPMITMALIAIAAVVGSGVVIARRKINK